MPESVDSNLIRGILLIVLIVAFLGTWAWAWSGKRKQVFEEASRLPLEEDSGRVPVENNRDHGKQDEIEE